MTGDIAHLYINGRYVDTLSLDMFGQGLPSGATHDVLVCAGINRDNALAGSSTLYEGFTVWSLP